MTEAGGELLAGRYRLDERGGVGALGEVWRARDLTLRRDVAVKRVRLDGHVETAARDRFRREAVAMAGVAHANVVSVYDSGTDVAQGRETAYLVMELLDGPSCSELIRSARVLDFAEIERIAAGVARGLAAAHANGVVHRDIKPGNVVIGKGVPKIVDFGIARLEQESTSTLTAPQTTLGTAAYMSPEQALGKHVGPASDVYSLGALIVALASGSPPFGASNALALMRAHIDDAPPLLTDLRHDAPAELSELVDRMLAKDPADRPTAAEVAGLLGDEELLPVTGAAATAALDAIPTAEGTDLGGEKPASLRTTAEITSAGSGTAHRVPGTDETGAAADSPDSPTRFSRGRALAWVLGLILVGLLVLLLWTMFGADGDSDGTSPSTTPAGTTAQPTTSPTEHLVTPTGPPTGSPTWSPTDAETAPTADPTAEPDDPATTPPPTGQTLDDAVGEADAVIRGVAQPEARDELVREWQGASAGLQGANAAEHLRDVIDQAEDLAEDGDLTADELSAVRDAVDRVIALLP